MRHFIDVSGWIFDANSGTNVVKWRRQLSAILAVLAGGSLNAGGLSQHRRHDELVGHRQAVWIYVGVLAAMIMACRSAVADTAAVAALLVPMIRQANYPVNRAAEHRFRSYCIIRLRLLIIFGVSDSPSAKLLPGDAEHHDGRR